MTTTALKPGDIVQHPEKGRGIIDRTLAQRLGVYYMRDGGSFAWTSDFTGWERAETVRPGHVQVRVDDLGEDGEDLSDWLNADEDSWELSGRLAIRVAKAIAAQRAESTPPADEQDASATEAATYQCPWCSTDVTFSLRLDRHPGVGVMVWVAADGGHACPPAQPDEPTLFGARIIVTDDLSGKAERWCRQHDEYWASENGALMTWAYLTERGTVTIGWDE